MKKHLLICSLILGLSSCSLPQLTGTVGIFTDPGAITLVNNTVEFNNHHGGSALSTVFYVEGLNLVTGWNKCAPVDTTSKTVNAYACKLGTLEDVDATFTFKPDAGTITYSSLTYYRQNSGKIPVFKQVRSR